MFYIFNNDESVKFTGQSSRLKVMQWVHSFIHSFIHSYIITYISACWKVITHVNNPTAIEVCLSCKSVTTRS